MTFSSKRRGLEEIAPSELVSAVRGIRFPADREALLQAARQNQAPDDVVRALSALPEQRYGGPVDVEDAFGRVQPDRGA